MKEHFGRHMKSIIRIRMHEGRPTWMVDTPDEKVLKLFGSTCLPTPWGAEMSAADVLSRLQALNPGDEFVFE